MVTKEDIERFLDRLAADEGGSYSEVEPGLWIARPSGELDFSVVVNYSECRAVIFGGSYHAFSRGTS